ncbi:MAG: hypothetical protein F4Y44_05610 [Chloroflexi bacterium]|nr:hypothetical protein [Chloroflexota bacterium]
MAGVISMVVFGVEVTLRNWQNRFLPPKSAATILFLTLVDTGMSYLCLLADVVETLKLHEIDSMRVQTADGALCSYNVVGMVEIELQVRAVELPAGARRITPRKDGLAHLAKTTPPNA